MNYLYRIVQKIALFLLHIGQVLYIFTSKKLAHQKVSSSRQSPFNSSSSRTPYTSDFSNRRSNTNKPKNPLLSFGRKPFVIGRSADEHPGSGFRNSTLKSSRSAEDRPSRFTTDNPFLRSRLEDRLSQGPANSSDNPFSYKPSSEDEPKKSSPFGLSGYTRAYMDRMNGVDDEEFFSSEDQPERPFSFGSRRSSFPPRPGRSPFMFTIQVDYDEATTEQYEELILLCKQGDLLKDTQFGEQLELEYCFTATPKGSLLFGYKTQSQGVFFHILKAFSQNFPELVFQIKWADPHHRTAGYKAYQNGNVTETGTSAYQDDFWEN